MRVLLVSTYDLGRQPLGLAAPAAWLRRTGIDVDCVDTSRDSLEDARIAAAQMVAFYLPMHTATRLAAPLIDRARRVNPSARLCAYGLYAPLNRPWLLECGVHDVLGPDAEADLVAVARHVATTPAPAAPLDMSEPALVPFGRPEIIAPDRTGLPPLHRYATLRLPDGEERVAGSTDATRGCKHLCRHCPIVPVYGGRFRAVPLDVVIGDVRTQVEAGARHISFGDADFFNGPTHARRLVEEVSRLFPGLTYDVTIKIEHLLRHADLLPVLGDTGCLFVTSAVESIDDEVLRHLRKGHTRDDFVRAVALCRRHRLTLAPTFIPFTPWTRLEGYVELLDTIDALDLVGHVAPVQLAIRLLVTAESPLLELPDIRSAVGEFDRASLTWPWRHADPRVDALQDGVMRLVACAGGQARDVAFAGVAAMAREAAGMPVTAGPLRRAQQVPHISEPWYCCAEPVQPF